MKPTTTLQLNDHCSASLQRTLRIPDDGNDYPLPPSLGQFTAFPTRDPSTFVVPIRQAEAMWLSFRGPSHKPHALKVGTGSVCAISGQDFDASSLNPGSTSGPDPQDYVVIPAQPWLDGINCGDGFIRQFVVAAVGQGHTVEEQVAGRDEGGIRLSLFEPRPGLFPDSPPRPRMDEHMLICCAMEAPAAPMGLGAGGRMRQEIYADEHGPDTWQDAPATELKIELVDAAIFEAVTGITAPGEPIDASTYTSHGLPWFDLISPTRTDIAAAARLANVRSLGDLGALPKDQPLPIPEWQVVRLLELRELVG